MLLLIAIPGLHLLIVAQVVATDDSSFNSFVSFKEHYHPSPEPCIILAVVFEVVVGY